MYTIQFILKGFLFFYTWIEGQNYSGNISFGLFAYKTNWKSFILDLFFDIE